MSRRVTLTFDNGPTPGLTDGVLAELAERSISAWFFPIGVLAAEHRYLVEQAHRGGHLIGNHTFTHSTPLGERDPVSAIEEITAAEAVLGSLACTPPVFRPFGRGGLIGGHLVGRAACDHLAAAGYTIALWNNVPGDWRDPDGWVDTAVRTAAAQEHSVVVLHDIVDACAGRLAELLDRLTALGVEFCHELPAECVPLRDGRPTTAFDLLGLDLPKGQRG